MNHFAILLFTVCLGLFNTIAHPQGTLQTIQERGSLRCGVSEGIPGFSQQDTSGTWRGMDVDLCRALAAAIFNDASKVDFVPLSPEERFKALIQKKVEVLIRSTSLTLAREATMPVLQAAINYYDGQGFMVHKDSGIRQVKQLEGSTICVTAHTSAEPYLGQYFKDQKIHAEILIFKTIPEALQAFESGKCKVYSTEKSVLAGRRQLTTDPEKYLVLQETITGEPLGPWVRDDDSQWNKIVKWVFTTTVIAEEYGITSQNVDIFVKHTSSPELSQFLKNSGFGLTEGWTYRIIKAVGNYAEIFDRNLGVNSPIRLDRSINKLWTQGGLMYSVK